MIQEIEESLQFLEKLGIDTTDVQVLDDLRLIKSVPSIVFVGLINRGKSSLINQIIGEDVLPTGINPETFACTILETSDSDLFTSYAKLADGTIETFTDKADFVAQVSRKKSNLKFRVAHARSNFRIPDGFALIDTPGCNDISVSYDSELSDLEQSWQNHGAMAGVLISSVPPGVSGQDVKLLYSLKRKFGNRVAVVLKQTQSSLTFEDLENAAGVWLQHGVSAIIVGDDAATSENGWGSGRLSRLEDVLSSMWGDAEKAKLEAVERLMLYFESEGKKILELPNIFYPDSKFMRDYIFEAFDRPKLVASLRKLANEKYTSDFEAPGISSREIKNHDQLQLAIEAAVRGSRRAAQSISSIVAKEAGVASLQHGDLLSQLIRRNLIELDSIVVGYTPSSRGFELRELRRVIDSQPAHSEARIMDLLRPGFTRLLEKTLSVREMTRIAENFGVFYPEETLSNLIRIWSNLEFSNDGYRDSDPILSSSIQNMANLASSNFLDELGKQIDAELSAIKSCIYQESSPIDDDWFGGRNSLGKSVVPYLILSLMKIRNNNALNRSSRKSEKEWLHNFDINKLTQLEQWNQSAIRFARGVAMFKGTLGTRTQQLAESILFDHTDGDFGKWILTTRDLKDAIKSGKYDDQLNLAHTTATWILALLGLRGLISGSNYALGLLVASCFSFVRNKVVGEGTFLKVGSFKAGKNYQGVKFQFLQYLISAFFILILILSSSSRISSSLDNDSASSAFDQERVENSVRIDIVQPPLTVAPQAVVGSVTVPAVYGLTVNEAIDVLSAQPLELKAMVVVMSSDEVDEGIVIGTDQPVGSLVEAGSTIVVKVSSGVPIASTTVPVVTTVPRVVTTVPLTTTTLTTPSVLVKGYRIYPGANLQNADLSFANLSGLNLTGANFTGANLIGSNLQSANLSGATLYGANLGSSRLRGANLTNANFMWAELNRANMIGAIVTGTNFTNASFYLTLMADGTTRSSSTTTIPLPAVTTSLVSTTTTINRNAVLVIDSDSFSVSSIQLAGTDPMANLAWWTIRIRDPQGGRLGALGTIGARLCPVSSLWPDGPGCTGATSNGVGNNVDRTFQFLFGISPLNGGIGGQWVPRIFGPVSGVPDVIGNSRLTVIPRP